MSDTVTARADAPPPEAQIAQILLGQLVPRLVYLFATLKLADHLSAGPKTAERPGVRDRNARANAPSRAADVGQSGLRH